MSACVSLAAAKRIKKQTTPCATRFKLGSLRTQKQHQRPAHKDKKREQQAGALPFITLGYTFSRTDKCIREGTGTKLCSEGRCDMLRSTTSRHHDHLQNVDRAYSAAVTTDRRTDRPPTENYRGRFLPQPFTHSYRRRRRPPMRAKTNPKASRSFSSGMGPQRGFQRPPLPALPAPRPNFFLRSPCLRC